jgi:hypothetical protein
MPTVHIRAEDLFRIHSSAGCCDCTAEAADAPDDEVWTIWNETMIYCPKCAESKNIGRSEG